MSRTGQNQLNQLNYDLMNVCGEPLWVWQKRLFIRWKLDWLSYIPRFQVSYPQTVCSIQSHFSIADHTRYKWGEHWRNSVQGHFWGHFNLTCKSPLEAEGKNVDQSIQKDYIHQASKNPAQYTEVSLAWINTSFSCLKQPLPMKSSRKESTPLLFRNRGNPWNPIPSSFPKLISTLHLKLSHSSYNCRFNFSWGLKKPSLTILPSNI